jgi:hypothetical protein
MSATLSGNPPVNQSKVVKTVSTTAATTHSKRPLNLRSRRAMALILTQTAILIAYWVYQTIGDRLGRTSVFTGATLLACLFALTLLGLRKRLPIAKFGSVATWTQVHLYMGLFSIAVYAMHVPRLIASGLFESTLSLLFLAVAASGIYGIYASRTLPGRITALGDEVRFDRFQYYREKISEAASVLVDQTKSLQASSSNSVILNFYQSHVQSFLQDRPRRLRILWDKSPTRARLMRQTRELDRYLTSDERSLGGSLSALIRRRDELDSQWALQLRLRLWVVVHLLMTLALIVASIMHVAIVLRYTL